MTVGMNSFFVRLNCGLIGPLLESVTRRMTYKELKIEFNLEYPGLFTICVGNIASCMFDFIVSKTAILGCAM